MADITFSQRTAQARDSMQAFSVCAASIPCPG